MYRHNVFSHNRIVHYADLTMQALLCSKASYKLIIHNKCRTNIIESFTQLKVQSSRDKDKG